MELMNLDSVYLPVLPGVNVQVRDLRVEIELSDCLLPTVHIEGNLDIRFPWQRITSHKFRRSQI